jgi:CheY-like chemotaxis protein
VASSERNIMSLQSSGTVRDAAAVTAHIVVACDDDWIGHLLDRHLNRAGYGTVRVGNGRDLLERLHGESQPSIVLLSLHGTLPHDRAVLEVVAADPALATRHSYVLLTVHWDMLPADFRALLQRLTVPVVPMPFRIEEVLAAVAQAAARLNG